MKTTRRNFFKWVAGAFVAASINIRLSQPLKIEAADLETRQPKQTQTEGHGFFKTWIDSAKAAGFNVTQTEMTGRWT